MGKYNPYSEYKNFNTVFLKVVPSHWDIKPLYITCGFRQGKAHEPFVDDDGEYICVNSRFVSTGGKKIKRCTENLTPAYLHDVLMVMSDLPNGRALAKAFYVDDNKKYAVNQRVCALTAQNINSKFLYYQLDRSPYFLMYDDGSNQTHLSNESYKKYPVLLPPFKEQQKIANFLDHETAKIDTLIEKQQQLIKLLKEKRQAVISHAVTKGLNPNTPMRDSGVEWLGEVPEHWVVSKFGYISQVVRGGSPRPAGDPTLFNGDYSPWVTVAEITKDDEVYLTETETFLTKKGSEQCRVFKSGTLLLSNSGATLGVPSILKIDANANDGVVGFEKLKLNHEFAYYYLSSLTDDLRDRIKQGSGQPNLNTDIVKGLVVPVPPKNEVEAIVAFIRKTRQHYRKLESNAVAGIELLQERRTALISAAVTGKIDVRDWVALEASNSHNKETAA